MEIIQERIEREFDIDIVLTAPSVTYKITQTNGDAYDLDNPSDYPDVQLIQEIQEPYAGLSITLLNPIHRCHHGIGARAPWHLQKTELIDAMRQSFVYDIPMNEIISNFFDKLKSRTQGYASMDYWIEDYKPTKLVKVNMMINGDPVDAYPLLPIRAKHEPLRLKWPKN